jgi:hypothetical protein
MMFGLPIKMLLRLGFTVESRHGDAVVQHLRPTKQDPKESMNHGSRISPSRPTPIRTKSLSRPIFVATALLMLATFGALYDEFVRKRRYAAMQRRMDGEFSAHLGKGARLIAEERKRSSARFQRLQGARQGGRRRGIRRAATRLAELDKRSADIVAMLASMDFGFPSDDRKGRIDEFINKMENAHDEDGEDQAPHAACRLPRQADHP